MPLLTGEMYMPFAILICFCDSDIGNILDLLLFFCNIKCLARPTAGL